MRMRRLMPLIDAFAKCIKTAMKSIWTGDIFFNAAIVNNLDKNVHYARQPFMSPKKETVNSMTGGQCYEIIVLINSNWNHQIHPEVGQPPGGPKNCYDPLAAP